MKTTRPPREIHDASKQGVKSKPHATWSSTKKNESTTTKAQPKQPNE